MRQLFKTLVKNILPYGFVKYYEFRKKKSVQDNVDGRTAAQVTDASRKKKAVQDKVKKYDIILSLGPACRVAYYLRKYNLRFCAAPLDWMMSYSLKTVLHLIETDFKDFFKNYYEDKERAERNIRWVVDRDNSIISLHYNDASDDNIKFRNMMIRRWHNTKEHLKQAESILFLSNRQCSIEVLKEFISAICGIYNANITYINIRDTYISGIITENYKINDRAELIEYKYNDKHPLGWEKKDNREFYIGNYIIWEKILKDIGLKQAGETIENDRD